MLACPIWLFVLICLMALPVATVAVYVAAMILLALMALPFKMLMRPDVEKKTDENNKE